MAGRITIPVRPAEAEWKPELAYVNLPKGGAANTDTTYELQHRTTDVPSYKMCLFYAFQVGCFVQS